LPHEDAASAIDFDIVQEHVQEELDLERGHSWLPESIRRGILTVIFACIVIVVEEVMRDTKLQLLSEVVSLRLRKVDPKKDKRAKKRKKQGSEKHDNKIK